MLSVPWGVPVQKAERKGPSKFYGRLQLISMKTLLFQCMENVFIVAVYDVYSNSFTSITIFSGLNLFMKTQQLSLRNLNC